MNVPDLRQPCHCDRHPGIDGAHWHSLVTGCPRDRVVARMLAEQADNPRDLRDEFVQAVSAPHYSAVICHHGNPGYCDRCDAGSTVEDRRPRERKTSRAQFNTYLERQFDAIRAINQTKGRDYTGDDDALANLRDMPRAGITGGQKLWVYLDKHLRAIETYIREGQVESEPIEGRIHDAVLYLLLFGALVEERRERDVAGAERDGAA